MATWLTTLAVGWRSRARLDDPFAVLEVQLALARLEREIGLLRRTGSRDFAQAHHLRAAMIAYDQRLLQACRLAGVAHPGTDDRAADDRAAERLGVGSGAELNGSRPGDPGDEVTRLLAVAALDAHGWRW